MIRLQNFSTTLSAAIMVFSLFCVSIAAAAGAEPSIHTSAHGYLADKPIDVCVKDLDPAVGYWITIVPEREAIGGYWKYFYTNQGARDGTFTFPGLAAGEYQVRLHFSVGATALVAMLPIAVWTAGSPQAIAVEKGVAMNRGPASADASDFTMSGSVSPCAEVLAQSETENAPSEQLEVAIGKPFFDPNNPIVSAMWQGSTVCGSEPVFFSMSTELAGQLDTRSPTQSAMRIEMADTPGGPPWARGYGSIRPQSGKYVFGVDYYHWSFVPPKLEKRIGLPAFELAANYWKDDQKLIVESFGRCGRLTLNMLPKDFATGSIKSAQDLPRQYQGTLGCYGSNNGNTAKNQNFAVRLSLDPVDEVNLGGRVEIIRADGAPTNELGVFDVFGEFDSERGGLTLVSGQWSSRKPIGLTMFDFFAELTDHGNRLVGKSNRPSCEIVEMTVPGTDTARPFVRPLTPSPVMEWNSHSDCVTLINWAYQGVKESGGKDFNLMSVSESQNIAIGLFADERFTPYFGKPFAELTAEERAHVVDVSTSCGFQQAFGHAMSRSGAWYHVKSYFPDRQSGQWLKLKRFRLLRARLSMEMEQLRQQSVGEADITSLRAQIDGLDERFSELWDTDKAQAKRLLESKLDAARGALLARLEAEIEKLPDDWAAFDTERRIRSEVASLGDGRIEDQARLNLLLDTKLGTASDHILNVTAGSFREIEPELRTLADLRFEIEKVWSRVGQHVSTDGLGFQLLWAVTKNFAEKSYPEFSEKVNGMIDGTAAFEERESQYVAVANLYRRVVPSDHRFHSVFTKYSAIVDGLRPVPTKKDLVAADGSPTSFGLKLATSEWVEQTWGSIFSALPYDFSFVTKSIRVSGLQKTLCTEADAGSFWCNFQLQMNGSVPFVDLLSLMPNRARFSWQGEAWSLVEASDRSRKKSTDYETDSLPCGLALGCTAGDIGASGILSGMW